MGDCDGEALVDNDGRCADHVSLDVERANPSNPSNSSKSSQRRRLGTTGHIYVTYAAAATYAAALGLRPEEARRELTELLLDATRPENAAWETPERWRRRSRNAGVDITARVAREGRLAVVVSVSVRSGYSPRRGGQRDGQGQ